MGYFVWWEIDTNFQKVLDFGNQILYTEFAHEYGDFLLIAVKQPLISTKRLVVSCAADRRFFVATKVRFMTTHELKTWPQYFEAVASGTKRFECRKNDRGFEPGDILLLREWSPTVKKYTGLECRVVVTWLLDDKFPGVAPGYVVMSIDLINESKWLDAMPNWMERLD